MITTIYGEMDEAQLTKREGVDEDDRARAEWIEYWKESELVHRSVSIQLKKGIEFNLELGKFT